MHDNPGISQIDLGGRLRMDRATTMTIVNRLQERAFMRRERSVSDGRKQALYVTEPGAAALAEAKRCIGEHEAWLKGRFSAEEMGMLDSLVADQDTYEGGADSVTRVNTNTSDDHVALIVLSTEASPELKQRGREAGATGWMAKPFDPQRMLDIVGKFI